jgi:hypothetical protein
MSYAKLWSSACLLILAAGCSSSEPPVAEEFRKMGGRDITVVDGKLIEVDLGSVGVTDAIMEKFKGLNDLKHLNLGAGKVTDAGLAPVAGMTELESLVLDFCPITDDGVATLSGLKKLKYFNVDNTTLTDKSMDTVAQFPALEKLSIALVSGITDEGLAKLDGLKSLKEVYMKDTGATPEGIAKFKAAHPGVILHGVDEEDEE